MYFLYTTKIKPVEVNVNLLYPLETSENHIFGVSGDTKGNNDLKWVKKTTISARVAQFDVVCLKH